MTVRRHRGAPDRTAIQAYPAAVAPTLDKAK